MKNDTSSLVATAFQWTATEAELVERSIRLFESGGRFHVRGDAVPFRTKHGLNGRTYSILGAEAEGRVWVAALPGRKVGVAVRVRSALSEGGNALRDAEAMVDSLRFTVTK